MLERDQRTVARGIHTYVYSLFWGPSHLLLTPFRIFRADEPSTLLETRTEAAPIVSWPDATGVFTADAGETYQTNRRVK